MSDDLVKRLKQSGTPSFDDGRGGNGLMLKAAARIEALEAALAKADALAEALSLQRSSQGNSVSPRTALALAAYREARASC